MIFAGILTFRVKRKYEKSEKDKKMKKQKKEQI